MQSFLVLFQCLLLRSCGVTSLTGFELCRMVQSLHMVQESQEMAFGSALQCLYYVGAARSLLKSFAVPSTVRWCVPQPNQWVLQTDCKAVLLPQNPLPHLKQTW